MTVSELRSLLFDVSNQDQEITIDGIVKLIGLKERYDGIENKVACLSEDAVVSDNFIKGWILEKQKAFSDISRFKF